MAAAGGSSLDRLAGELDGCPQAPAPDAHSQVIHKPGGPHAAPESEARASGCRADRETALAHLRPAGGRALETHLPGASGPSCHNGSPRAGV